MKVTKQSLLNLDEYKHDPMNYVQQLDKDVQDLHTAMQGRIRFGDPTDKYKGQNVSGEYHVVASTGTADTEFSFTHTVGAIPGGYLVTMINKGGVIYKGTTTWTSTTVYFKCSAATAAVTIFLLK